MEKQILADDMIIIKSLIEMASSFEDADSIIEEFTERTEIEQKLNFLFDHFDVAIIGGSVAEIDKGSELLIKYEAILTTIINRKWR